MKQLLNQPSLQRLLNKTCELDSLNNTLRTYLPSELVDQVWVANFRQGCLILATQSAAWGTHLRYLLPQLRDALRQDGVLPNLTEIKYIVSPPTASIDQRASRTPTLSLASREQIASAAQSLPTELRQALLRLTRDT
jgi:hypothetical protein